MQINFGKRLAESISFLLLVEIFYFYNTYVAIGGFEVGYQYVGCILLLGLGAIAFLVKPDVSYLGDALGAAGILAAPYFMTLLYSMVIWIFDFTPIRQMISGFFAPSYMILCIACVVSAAYVLREKMAEYSFWALTAAFGLLLLPALSQFGVAEFFARLMQYVRSSGSTGLGVSLEDTSLAYIYVFFWLYFMFHWKEEPLWKFALKSAIILFALLDTFKRSGFLALAVGFAIAFLYTLIGAKYRKYFLNFVVFGFVLCAFLYIPFVRYGLFNRIADALHIDTSYRTTIYAYYARYYEFSPTYLGRGFGWVHRLISDVGRDSDVSSINVHCDYVRQYIELGFWGYLLWMLMVFPWVVKRMSQGKNKNDDASILAVSVAIAVLRLTENVSSIYSATLGLGIIVTQSFMNSRYQIVSKTGKRGADSV